MTSYDHELPAEPVPQASSSPFVSRTENSLGYARTNPLEFHDQPKAEYDLTFRAILPPGGFTQVVRELVNSAGKPILALEIGGTGSWLFELKAQGVDSITAMSEFDTRTIVTKLKQKLKNLAFQKGDPANPDLWKTITERTYELIVCRPMTSVDTMMPTDPATQDFVKRMLAQLAEGGVLVTQLPGSRLGETTPAWINELKTIPGLEVNFVNPKMRSPDGNILYLPLLSIKKVKPNPEQSQVSNPAVTNTATA